jgi:hypothetical protein
VVGSAPCTPKISATRLTKPRRICLIGWIRWDNRVAQWRLGSSSRRPSATGGRRRDRARNAPAGASAVHRCRPGARTRSGSGGGASNRQRPQKAVPTGDTRGWSGRSSHCLTSSRNYACAASLSDQRRPITDIAAQLEIHAKQELHALILSRQIDYPGKMPVVTPEPVSPLARLA